jgi:hypothetical protein
MSAACPVAPAILAQSRHVCLAMTEQRARIEYLAPVDNPNYSLITGIDTVKPPMLLGLNISGGQQTAGNMECAAIHFRLSTLKAKSGCRDPKGVIDRANLSPYYKT